MQAGKLRNRVKIQRQSTGSDDYGQPLSVWSDVAEIGADIRHLSGIESVKAGAETSVVRASARVRYREGITAGMRLLYGATIYNITAVLPDMAKRQYVDLVCEVVS